MDCPLLEWAVLQGPPRQVVHQSPLAESFGGPPGEEPSMQYPTQAFYLMELQELLLGGQTVRVPDNIAQTVTPEVMDIRYVKRWAVHNRILPETAEIGISM